LCGNSLSIVGVMRSMPGTFFVCRSRIVVFSSFGVTGFMGS